MVLSRTHAQDLLPHQFGVDRVEAAERFIEDEQARTMQHRGDELHLLRHAFAQFLHLLVPPGHHLPALEPFLELLDGVALAHAFQPGEVNRLLAHLHLLVQATLFGQVAQLRHVGIGHGVAIEQHAALRPVR